MVKLDFKVNKFIDNTPKTEYVTSINIANNPNINGSLLDNIINNGTINNYSDQELFILLSNNLGKVLLNIFEKKDKKYIKMIISDRFLRVLIQVVNNIEIDYMNKIYLSKLCYDYINLDDKFKNATISNMIYKLAIITNKKHIPLLIGLGIPEDIACYIVLSRYSTDNEFKNINRMNFVIMTARYKFTEQIIVYIYQYLFERVTMLFEATMLDVLDTTEEWYTKEIGERYSLITNAVLDILNSLPSDAIRRVLDDYVQLYHISYMGKKTRCDLRCLSSDYERIRIIAEDMISKGIRLP